MLYQNEKMTKDMEEFTLEHIGYLTDNIENTAEAFKLFGFQPEVISNDDTQQTRICFLKKPGETTIELVEPYEENKTMMKMLKKGVSAYHTCYAVDDISAVYKRLTDMDYTPLFEPVEAPAFGQRLICYFWKRETGLIEIVSKK
jgi:methylmalonyl-CoA/ethylmalonyl-CoA epimerase